MRLRTVVAVVVVMGCHGDSHIRRVPKSSRGATVTLVDSVVLQDPDSMPLGAYTAFVAHSGRGDYFVNDMQSRRVLHFRGNGAFAGVVGKPGSGPGEFQLPGPLHLVAHDSLLAVVDVNRHAMEVFDASTGGFDRMVALPAQDIGQDWQVEGDTVYFALHMTEGIAGRWVWTHDSVHAIGRMPTRFRGASGVLMGYGVSELAPHDAGFAMLLPGEIGLDFVDSAGAWLGSVPIPAARRRGQPDDLVARQQKLRPTDANQVLASASAGLNRQADGNYLIAYVDMEMLGTAGHGGRYGAFRTYLALLAPDGNHACVDAELPVETDVTPIPFFRGDTVSVLARQVNSQNRVRSVVYSYVVSPTGCDWVPTGGFIRGDGNGVREAAR
ncbi:MAG TPA: 6-bladed beta-propeller [Gemmatimonadales bacterium]|jgi:hypothetical protein